MPLLDDLATLEHATLEELEQLIELSDWERIEWAEQRSSPKAIRFQKAFFARKDETGRPCSKFVAIGGNRSSKSFTTVRLCFAKYIRDVARSGDHFWAGAQNVKRSAQGVQKELWQSLPAGMFMGRAWDSKNGFGDHSTVKIRTRDGGHCTVEFRSADQDLNTFETAKLRGVLWDENLPEALYNRLLPRLIDLRGFFLYSDINNQAWPIDRLEEALPEAGVYYQRFTMFDNERNLPTGAIEEFKAGIPEDEIRLRVFGDPGSMEGVVFKSFKDSVSPGHLIDDSVDFSAGIPDDWPRWRKIDFGETAPMAVSWSTIAPNEHIYVYREQYEKGKSIYANAKLIHEASGATWHEVQRESDEFHDKPWMQIVAKGGEKYVATYLDPACFTTDNGSLVSVAREFADCGIECRPWPRINLYGEHAAVARFKLRLERGTWHVFKSCTNMRREMRVWKHKLDREGKPVATDAYDNKDNHLIDGQKGFIITNPTFAQPKVVIHNG